MSLIQIITPYLTWGTDEYNIPKDGRIHINDDEDGLIWLREAIFTDSITETVVLMVYNRNTTATIDLYLKLLPKFKLVIRTPIVLYDLPGTTYEYNVTNNVVFHYQKTPAPEDIYEQVGIIIKRLSRMVRGNIVVIGNIDREPNRNVYYINSLVNKPESVQLVIDTMINANEEYITFSESVDRFFSFRNVIYYRLISQNNLKTLPMEKPIYKHKLILEAMKYGKPLNELFPKGEIDALLFYIQELKLEENGTELLKYPLDLLPAAFLIAWKAKGYDQYAGTLIAVLLSNTSLFVNMFNIPDRTEDANFDYINRRRIRDSIKEIFGEGGLLLYLNIFNQFFKHISDGQQWCNSLYINFFTIYKYQRELEKMGEKFAEIDPLVVYTQAAEVLKSIYNISTLRKRRVASTSINGAYVDNNGNIYQIDPTYTINNLSETLPEQIVPLIVDRTISGQNTVYMFL